MCSCDHWAMTVVELHVRVVNSCQEENGGEFSVCFVVIILFKLFKKHQQ